MSADRVMLITGASQRIGASIARRAHRQGFRVAVHYRSSATNANELVEALNKSRPDSAAGFNADFADLNTCQQLIDAASARWGRLDVLVNNASEFFPTPIGSISPDDIDRTFRANVYAPLMLIQSALPELVRTGGSVVNILDIYAQLVHPEHSVYCASKAALSMITRSMALECAPQVRVNGIAPGAILWPEGEAEISQEVKSAMLEKIPLRKTGSAEQVAAAVSYLCSDDADFITGQTISIDGGRMLGSA